MTAVSMKSKHDASSEAVRKDVVAGAVAIAGIGLFVFTGSRVVTDAIGWLFRAGGGSDQVAVVAVLLNIALILFAWRRYAEIRVLVAENAAAEERAKVLATHDQLTRLLIRPSLLEACDELIRRSAASGLSVAMLCFDLDHFKRINDVYGHSAGDTVLRSIGDLLLEEAGEERLCARIGSNEFAIALSFETHDEKGLAKLADRLKERLAQPFDVGGVNVHVTASVGLATLAADCCTTEALLRRADIAVNVAKDDAVRKIIWFDNSMESQLRARNEIEAGLRRGIPLGEFVPFYQPLVDLATGEVCGFEALARWAHPAGGYVDPDIFIPVAEETGLIGELFDSLFTRALSDAIRWDGAMMLAVNISAYQLKDRLLAHKILTAVSKSGFPPHRLEIEITETSLFENLPTARSVVASLKNHGINLALDDFGTGYSSLAHLRALPFDRIKIDRSFVSTMSKDPESLAIVRAVTMMGESLGVAVTAEGIEDAATASALRSIGCDKGQGWLFGRPLSSEDVYGLLAERDMLSHKVAWSPPLPNASVTYVNRGMTN